MAKGPLIILSGPSGSGKSTVIAQLLREADLPLRLSISATTRDPRPGEQNGVQYHFWNRERFVAELQAGAFLEWADVYGHYYGTLRQEVEPFREQGIGVLLEIDVQGAAAVRKACPDAVSVFLRPSSLEALAERLHKRGTESEAVVQRRLAAARWELDCEKDYDFTVINDDIEDAVLRLRDFIRRQFTRTEHAG